MLIVFCVKYDYSVLKCKTFYQIETLSENWAEKPPPPQTKTPKHFIQHWFKWQKSPPPLKICALFIYKRFEGYKNICILFIFIQHIDI